MRNRKLLSLISAALLAGSGVASAAPRKDASAEPELHRAVRESLERLPYYGVFDILNYEVKEGGIVELSGFAFRDALKKEAEAAVAKVSGVKEVLNRIEDLEWGVTDDEIRAKVYLTIYRDSFLSRYGTATDMALANGVGFGPRPFGPFGAMGIGNPFFPGFNPAGGYGIQRDLTWAAHRKGFRIVEEPIEFVERVNGQSKLGRDVFVEALKKTTQMGLAYRGGQVAHVAQEGGKLAVALARTGVRTVKGVARGGREAG